MFSFAGGRLRYFRKSFGGLRMEHTPYEGNRQQFCALVYVTAVDDHSVSYLTFPLLSFVFVAI